MYSACILSYFYQTDKGFRKSLLKLEKCCPDETLNLRLEERRCCVRDQTWSVWEIVVQDWVTHNYSVERNNTDSYWQGWIKIRNPPTHQASATETWYYDEIVEVYYCITWLVMWTRWWRGGWHDAGVILSIYPPSSLPWTVLSISPHVGGPLQVRLAALAAYALTLTSH